MSLHAGVLETPLDDGWSVKDVVAHLCDAEDVAFEERIRGIAETERPFIESIDPPARLDAGNYRERPLDHLLDELADRRARNLELLRSLAPEDLKRTGEHDQAGDVSIENITFQWAYHDLMHLKQIASMLQESLVDGMGNTRRFYGL